jgi:hypothetical protein
MLQYSTLARLTTAPSRAVPSPAIDRYQCPACHTAYLGQPLLRPQSCSTCGRGTLIHTGTWDMRYQAWPGLGGV